MNFLGQLCNFCFSSESVVSVRGGGGKVQLDEFVRHQDSVTRKFLCISFSEYKINEIRNTKTHTLVCLTSFNIINQNKCLN